MRVLRSISGSLLLLTGAFCGGSSLLESGARHGWGEVGLRSGLFEGRALVWTLGALAFTSLGIVVARTGKGAWTAIGIVAVAEVLQTVRARVGTNRRHQPWATGIRPLEHADDFSSPAPERSPGAP